MKPMTKIYILWSVMSVFTSIHLGFQSLIWLGSLDFKITIEPTTNPIIGNIIVLLIAIPIFLIPYSTIYLIGAKFLEKWTGEELQQSQQSKPSVEIGDKEN